MSSIKADLSYSTLRTIFPVSFITKTSAKIVWSLVLLACVAAFSAFGAQSLIFFFQYPVRTTVKIIDGPLEFPAVSACSLNPYKVSALKEKAPQVYNALREHSNHLKENGESIRQKRQAVPAAVPTPAPAKGPVALAALTLVLCMFGDHCTDPASAPPAPAVLPPPPPPPPPAPVPINVQSLQSTVVTSTPALVGHTRAALTISYSLVHSGASGSPSTLDSMKGSIQLIDNETGNETGLQGISDQPSHLTISGIASANAGRLVDAASLPLGLTLNPESGQHVPSSLISSQMSLSGSAVYTESTEPVDGTNSHNGSFESKQQLNATDIVPAYLGAGNSSAAKFPQITVSLPGRPFTGETNRSLQNTPLASPVPANHSSRASDSTDIRLSSPASAPFKQLLSSSSADTASRTDANVSTPRAIIPDAALTKASQLPQHPNDATALTALIAPGGTVESASSADRGKASGNTSSSVKSETTAGALAAGKLDTQRQSSVVEQQTQHTDFPPIARQSASISTLNPKSADSHASHGSDGSNDFRPPDTDTLAWSNKMEGALPYLMKSVDPDGSLASSLGYQLDEFVVWCRFAGQKCNLSRDVQAFTDSKFGNCFTFNFQSQYRLVRAGQRLGLRVIFNTESGDQLPFILSSGFVLIFHDPNEKPFMQTSAIKGSADVHYSYAISMRQSLNAGTPYSPCVPNDDSYSIETCLSNCYQKRALDKCGCGDPNYPLPSGSSYCNITQKPCVDTVADESSWDSSLSPCTCQPPCSMKNFDFVESRAAWPTDRYTPSECSRLEGQNFQDCKSGFRTKLCFSFP